MVLVVIESDVSDSWCCW